MAMKNTVFGDIKTQVVPHRRHITNWNFVSQRTAFFTVTAVKTSNVTS
jgi:hypothetical protein